MGVFQNNLLAASAAAASAGGGAFYSYQIEQSARFSRAENSYLTGYANNFGTGDRRKWTISFWIKLTASDGFGSNNYFFMSADTNAAGAYDALTFDIDSESRFYYQVANKYYYPNGSFRDPNAWSHFLIVFDSDNSTADDRRIMYLNGSRLGTHDAGGGIAQNTDSQINWGTKTHYIGRRQDNSSSHHGDFLLAEYIFADGQAYAPTQFGESKNGVWIPKDPTGTNFGTTGQHLKFENASDLGNDSSGNNNDWTVSNMGTDHQVLDSPTFGS